MNEKRMTFGEHLDELRRRVLNSVIGLIAAMVVAMIFQDDLMAFMCAPHRKAMQWLNYYDARLILGTYPAGFMSHLKLAFIVGLVAASPYVAYQLWKFIGAGLFDKEKKYVRFYAPLSLVLFLAGCAFAYFVLIPIGLYYLAGYGDPKAFEPKFFLADYLNLVLLLIFIMGIFFELPVIMLFFAQAGLISPQTYVRWRKFAIVTIVILGAVLTPGGDVVSQVLMAGPLWLLYESGILLSRLVYPVGMKTP